MTGHTDGCDCWPCVLRPYFDAGYRLGRERGYSAGAAWAYYAYAQAQIADDHGHPPGCPCAKCVYERAKAAYLWLESGH